MVDEVFKAPSRPAARAAPAEPALWAGSWNVHLVVRDEQPLDVDFRVDDSNKIVGVSVRPGTISKPDEIKLRQAKKKSAYEHQDVVLPVSSAELRALARSAEVMHLREEVNELSIPGTSNLDEAPILARRDLSPDQKYRLIQKYNRELEQEDAQETAQKRAQGARVAKKLVKLIAKFGGPWTNAERPTNHPSMLF